MEVQYIDALITVFQSILFTYIVNYCLEKEKIKYNKKLVLCIVLLSINGFIITYLLGNLSICIFITHTLGILIIYFTFRKKCAESNNSIQFNIFNSTYMGVDIW
ncbi:hypothetical protein DZE42_001086 [Clostridium beijerinckii]|nr:hypothetical protein [Clostridium beijerinckii]